MPVVTIQVIKGVFDKEQKAEMIKRVTEAIAEIEARPEPMQNMLPWVYCVIEEVDWDNWGGNGMQMTPEVLYALKKGIIYMGMKQQP